MKRRWLWLGLGAAAGAAAMFVRQAQARRLALASRANELTLRAVHQLGAPAESRFVQVSGLQLHTVVAGPEGGPLVILLHGFPECWYSWRHQIKALAQAGYRVAAPDQRGYNLSARPRGVSNYHIDRLTTDVYELVFALGYERANIVGHDWGGAVAWDFAMHYPHVVEKLIVLNAPHHVAFARELARNPAQRRKSWYIYSFRLPWLPETLLGLAPQATAQFFFRRTAARAGAFSDADLQVMAAALAQPGALTAMLNWYRAAFRYSLLRRRKIIETPTLLIWAEDDVALTKSLTYNLDEWVPELKVHYISRCGHWVQNEAPDEVNAHVLAFLEEAR